MNIKFVNASILLLRWTLGLVVVLESAEFTLSNSAAHFLAKAGLPSWIQPVLGGLEIFAAVLFLLPFTAKIGSYLLFIILRSLLYYTFCMANSMSEDWWFTPRPFWCAWPARETQLRRQGMSDPEWMEVSTQSRNVRFSAK